MSKEQTVGKITFGPGADMYAPPTIAQVKGMMIKKDGSFSKKVASVKKKRKRGFVFPEAKLVGWLNGIKVYSSNKVPDNEVWFINKNGELMGGIW